MQKRILKTLNNLSKVTPLVLEEQGSNPDRKSHVLNTMGAH